MMMSGQLGLFNQPVVQTVSPRRAVPGSSIEARFEAFHEANPHVYEALRRLALRMRARGRVRIGMKMLFEVLRWEYAMSTDDPNSDFKLNNNYTAHYARMLMANEPRLDGAFEVRTQRAEVG